MSEFSQSDLSNLWIQAGGPVQVAALMGAIGMAESGGNPSATNASSGACGLFQIFPPESGCSDPFTNAQIAVRKYNSQGLNAWSAYTNGSYKQFLGSNADTSGTTTLSSSSGCRTSTIAGVCLDSAVGFGSIAFGVALIITGVVLLVTTAQMFAPLRKAASATAKVATTAIALAPK